MSARTEIIRREILDQCYAHRPLARDADRMAALCRREGELMDAVGPEFDREAAYLVDRQLIEVEPEDVFKGHKRYRITAAGCDHVEKEGFHA